MSQKEKVNGIFKAFADKNGTILQTLSEVMSKINLLTLRNFFRLTAEIEKVNFSKLASVVEKTKAVLEDSPNKKDVKSLFLQTISFSKILDEELGGVYDN